MDRRDAVGRGLRGKRGLRQQQSDSRSGRGGFLQKRPAPFGVPGEDFGFIGHFGTAPNLERQSRCDERSPRITSTNLTIRLQFVNTVSCRARQYLTRLDGDQAVG